MKPRGHLMGLLVTGILLLTPGQARANIWDYLEQLSGPGPFGGGGSLAFSGGCVPVPIRETVEITQAREEFFRDKLNLLGIPPSKAIRSWTPCFFFDKNLGLSADAVKDRFPEVRLGMWDIGVTFPVARMLELGVGVGRMTFTTNTTSVSRTSITVPRIVLKPLLFVPRWENQKWAGFFKFYMSAVTIDGLAGQDFGVSNSGYDETGQRNWLTSVGVAFDLLELAQRKYR